MKHTKKYFIIYKPYKVLSQFTDADGNVGLGSVFELQKDLYPVGRLDLDSEGLLILTNDKSLNANLLSPENAHYRTYWVEVEGEPSEDALKQLASGVTINVDGPYQTMPCLVKRITPEGLPERNPAVNVVKHPVRTWLEIKLVEGKNRQVRKMTAHIGHPTLRLIRTGIEDLNLFPLSPGQMTMVSEKVLYKKLKLTPVQ